MMSSVISDERAIEKAIEDYIKGCQSGDGLYFKSSFHPEARMFGAVGEQRYDFWGQDFTDFFLLSRIEGEWKIVAKAFAHTGPTGG